MNDPQDPPRLIDDQEGSERLRNLIRECRGDVAGLGDVQRLESKLAPIIWAPIAPPTTGPGATTGAVGAASTATATGATIKVGAAVAIAVGLAGGGLWLAKSTSPTPSERTPSSETATKTNQAPATENPPAAAANDDEQAAPKGEPDNSGRASTIERQRNESANESESDLLGRAQSVLHSDPGRALALATEHRSKFPNGALAQEREVLSIEALERLGRHKEAVARANSFLHSYPGSAHRSKVNSVIGR